MAIFIMVHGAWHGAWCFSPVIPRLVQAGHRCLAIDLPGNGVDAPIPVATHRDPFDGAAFATEVTASAQITLDTQADAVSAQVELLARSGDEPVVLVGHSMGGHVITRVAERMPDLVAKLIYVTAFMPASGVPALAYIQSDENVGERVGPLLQADPEAIGALRINPSSSDPAHREAIIAAFAATVPAQRHDAILNLLTPDLPIQVPAMATQTTVDHWGAIPRAYVRCSRDEAIMPACQDRMISEADAFAPDRPTEVFDLDTCHSPFLSDPGGLASLLIEAAPREGR